MIYGFTMSAVLFLSHLYIKPPTVITSYSASCFSRDNGPCPSRLPFSLAAGFSTLRSVRRAFPVFQDGWGHTVQTEQTSLIVGCGCLFLKCGLFLCYFFHFGASRPSANTQSEKSSKNRGACLYNTDWQCWAILPYVCTVANSGETNDSECWVWLHLGHRHL